MVIATCDKEKQCGNTAAKKPCERWADRAVAVLAFTTCSTLVTLWPAVTIAQTTRYPVRPVRLIVPLAPAGTTDIVARIVAQKFTEALGQTVIVDNRPGAGTTLGSALVARAAPDGYTLLFTSASIATNAALYPKLPFDTIRDFAPVGPVGQSFYVLAVQPALGVNSVQDLIAAAKAKPKQILYASAGQGTITHLAVELFMANAQIRMQDVPFKGGAPALLAFLSAQVPVIFSPIAEILPHLRGGAKVRTLAVTNSKRVPELPETPTLTEAGVPGSEVVSKSGVYAPAGTSESVIKQLNSEINRMVQQAEVRERFLSQGLVPIGGSPAELSEYLKSEIARWTKVVKGAGIKVE
jgi:tripartite-type tricarboxylate transporter receptor subunit TctC